MRTITADELLARIRSKLAARPHKSSYSHFAIAPAATPPAAYALVVGAGFSAGVVPLVRELMHETIGGYYVPDQDQSSLERPSAVLRKHASSFWEQFNSAALETGIDAVETGRDGLPRDPAAAYQKLFTYEGATVLFAIEARNEREARTATWLEKLKESRYASGAVPEPAAEGNEDGERFVKGFLRYVMDPGAEHGYGSAGRSHLNGAHAYLAALLEAQQVGLAWDTCAFCRTVFTTNFDTLLQNALQMVNLLYTITDRPELGVHPSEFAEEETSIHLVYTHGSILRHNPASSTLELDALSNRNVEVLRGYLESRDVITVGYSGWSDGLMSALKRCDPDGHAVYWCDVRPQPAAHVVDFLTQRQDTAAYVQLDEGGAGALMRRLYESLVSSDVQRDPMQRYRKWRAAVYGV